eukprot:1160146-Pelagomonas_calceolata.AAC.20
MEQNQTAMWWDQKCVKQHSDSCMHMVSAPPCTGHDIPAEAKEADVRGERRYGVPLPCKAKG